MYNRIETVGIWDKQAALEEAGLERERALAARERQAREEMEIVAKGMVREERERGERRLGIIIHYLSHKLPFYEVIYRRNWLQWNLPPL